LITATFSSGVFICFLPFELTSATTIEP